MSYQTADAGMTPEQAVSYFPRGLLQPEGSFRFSADALLLSCLFAPEKGETLLDIGTGCGVVALGALLRRVCTRAVGIELSEALVRAANENAKKLGLDENFTCFQYDAENLEASQKLIEELSIGQRDSDKTRQAGFQAGFDLVVANPPFYSSGSGRLPANALRRQALFAKEQTLDNFCRLAAATMQPEGRFGLIYPAEGIKRLETALAGSALHIHRRLPVIFRKGKTPARYLVEAGKEPAPRPVQDEAPLVLHDTAAALTPEAILFCPYLAIERK